ncbi:MAG TPA: DUF559 domain-containing protein [Mycobacterium sp.]|nr:DUF559 domain-containing protein [Mycobacterium sp.]
MRPQLEVPEALRGRPFTRAEAAACGLTRRMLQGRRFRRLARDVYVSAEQPLDHRVLCRAACRADPDAVLSHASAVLAYGLPLGIREPEPWLPHLATPVGLPPVDRGGALCHVELIPAWQVAPTPLGPATSPARTFIDRAAELRLEDLVALGDAMLHRRLVSVEELAALVQWGVGRRGIVRARQAVPLLDGRAESPMESWTRVTLALAELPPPEVGAEVRDEYGTWLARADLVWRQAKLIVEYDGRVHLGERQRRIDAQRHNLLVAAGWTVLHITADEVLRRPWALEALVRDCLAAAAKAA